LDDGLLQHRDAQGRAAIFDLEALEPNHLGELCHQLWRLLIEGEAHVLYLPTISENGEQALEEVMQLLLTLQLDHRLMSSDSLDRVLIEESGDRIEGLTAINA